MSEKDSALVSDINIVPFVDVVLVVLIIFLVIAPAFVRPGFDIILPKAVTAKKLENVQVFLSIDIQGTVYLNARAETKQKITQHLKNLVQKNKNVKAVIAADKNVAHGNVIKLIDTIRKAGVKSFAVSVEPGE